MSDASKYHEASPSPTPRPWVETKLPPGFRGYWRETWDGDDSYSWEPPETMRKVVPYQETWYRDEARRNREAWGYWVRYVLHGKGLRWVALPDGVYTLECCGVRLRGSERDGDDIDLEMARFAFRVLAEVGP